VDFWVCKWQRKISLNRLSGVRTGLLMDLKCSVSTESGGFLR